MELFGSRQRPFLMLFLLVGLSLPAQARVFSFATESVAPYVAIRGGLPTMDSEPYRWQSAGTYSGDAVNFIYGGEFGVSLRGSVVGMSLGILVDTFNPIEGGRGATAAGQNLYTVNAKGIAYGPSLNFDYQLQTTATYLWKLVVGGGYKIAKIENIYDVSTAGQSLAAGQAAITETYTMTSPFATFGVATEFYLSGSTTMSVFAGYHLSFNKEWKYKGGGQNFAGAHSDGAVVSFEDGTMKPINWSYPFLQIGFQFYVDSIR